MAKPVKVRTSSGEWADLAVQVPSANDPTFTGTTSSSTFNSTQSSGDEGGEIKFSKSATNTTLDTGVTLDVYQDKVRLFETGGTNRGGYFDMSTLSTGVGTNLAPGLTLISSTDFSAAATVTIDNVFTSTYKDYRIIFSAYCSNTSTLAYLRYLDTSGAEVTSGYYAQTNNLDYATSGSTFATTNYNTTAIPVVWIGNTAATQSRASMDISSPYQALGTYATGQQTGIRIGSAYQGGVFNAAYSATTQLRGIKLFNDTTANMTGSIKVYGYK